MEIRKANQDDASRLDELLTKLIQDERQYDVNINPDFVVNKFYFYQLGLPNHVSFVAVDNGRIVGYVYGFINGTPPIVLHSVVKLDALFIEEEYRNKGIGKALVNEFKKWAFDASARYVELSVLIDNEYGKKLYKDCGFKLQKEFLNCDLKGD
jgi:ribosomal protein S18 acetylase RimI-like enzyme